MELWRRHALTRARRQSLESADYIVTEIWGCAWKALRDGRAPAASVTEELHGVELGDEVDDLAARVHAYLREHVWTVNMRRKYMTETRLLEQVERGEFQGLILCQARPGSEAVRRRFSEFCCLFARETVSAETLGPYMLTVARQLNMSASALRDLTTTLLGVVETRRPQLLDARYAHFLLKVGYELFDVQLFVELKEINCMRAVISKLVGMRSQADSMRSGAQLAVAIKLIMNASECASFAVQ